MARSSAPATTLAGLRAEAMGWLPARSRAALLRGVRSAVVVAGLFAFCTEVLENLQIGIFAGFGGFATLVLTTFAGTRREKLMAHIALALAGSVLLSVGTLVSESALAAALVTLPVAFAVYFTGVSGPNGAAGVTGALLPYVLAAATAAPASAIPDRLAGWWMASVGGTIAVLLLSAPAPADRLRPAMARLARALAVELRDALAGVPVEQARAESLAAGTGLGAAFGQTPLRPTGLAAPDQALANAVELLEWCAALLADALAERADLSDVERSDRALLEGTAASLEATAAMLEGGEARPDLAGLERLREQCLEAVGRLVPQASGFREQAQASFHAQAVAVAALALGADAEVAVRAVDARRLELARVRFAERLSAAPVAGRITSVARTARRHASLRSVWFINSARGAVALAVAVAVADLSNVQHGFWVVLGALSVLRSNAATTGSTVTRALGGTVLGFIIGGALLLAIGADDTILWLVLPVAIFIAAYSVGTAPFALGQAAFTITVVVLFNLLLPIGWKVGVIRVEDVAIGCGISLLVGLLFWPRGAALVVADDLADSYRTGASFLAEAVGWTAGTRGEAPHLGPATTTAALRLDGALRGFLTEQGVKRIEKEQLWKLVGGTLRLRLTAHAIASLPRDPIALEQDRAALERRTMRLTNWYEQLAGVIGTPPRDPIPMLQAPAFAPDETVHASSGSHYGVWLCEHLDHLAEDLCDLIAPAQRIAHLRRTPFWR